MRKARFTEHQIIAVIKPDERLKMSVGRSVSLKPPITTGSLNMAEWRPLILKR